MEIDNSDEDDGGDDDDDDDGSDGDDSTVACGELNYEYNVTSYFSNPLLEDYDSLILHTLQ